MTGGNGIGGDATPDFSDLADMVARTEAFDHPRPRRNNVTTPFTNAAPAPRAPTPAVDEEDMGLFEELHSENPSERDNGPDDSTLGSVPGLTMCRTRKRCSKMRQGH